MCEEKDRESERDTEVIFTFSANTESSLPSTVAGLSFTWKPEYTSIVAGRPSSVSPFFTSLRILFARSVHSGACCVWGLSIRKCILLNFHRNQNDLPLYMWHLSSNRRWHCNHSRPIRLMETYALERRQLLDSCLPNIQIHPLFRHPMDIWKKSTNVFQLPNCKQYPHQVYVTYPNWMRFCLPPSDPRPSLTVQSVTINPYSSCLSI